MESKNVSQTPQTIVIEQPRKGLGGYGKFLLALLMFSIFINVSQLLSYQSYFNSNDGVSEKYHSGEKHAASKIAIISVEGAILDGDGFVKRQIDLVRDDQAVKAVVLRVNSPGGTVTASDYILHHLKLLVAERKIPLVVSMGGICASGGYYVSMAVGDQKDAIFAEPTTWTGSIGVIIPHYDASGLLESWHVKDDSIASHKFKQLGSPTRVLTKEERAEERAILQSLVDDSFRDFKQIVRDGRPKFRDDEKALDGVATGQVFTANQALELGLVDKIGFVEAAIDRAAELAGVSKSDVRVVKYTRPAGIWELVTGAEARQGLDLGALLDLTAPRAYYLNTWMPAILTNRKL